MCVCVNQIETPMLNLAKRVDHWTWDPNEERRRQERWQQEQERLLQVYNSQLGVCLREVRTTKVLLV